MSEKPRQYEGHIVVVTCPLQGHAAPLMKLSHRITKFGVKVTFLKVDMTHALTGAAETWDGGVRVVTIPSDGVTLGKLEGVKEAMPGHLEDLLKSPGGKGIIGVVIDSPVAWMQEIPRRMGLKVAVYWCSSAACLSLGINIPHLIHSGNIDPHGTSLKSEGIKLLPDLPDMFANELQWYFPSDANNQKSMFRLINGIVQETTKADWILCNWFNDLYPSATNLIPTVLPIGPLLTEGRSSGSFYSEDSTCLTWLDKQPEKSVVYVAFGSTSRFSQRQLDELAEGLALIDRPFLWVAWSGLTDGSGPTYREEFVERVGRRGKVVEWAPQEAVLGHPSTACFVTHCGWGSFMESLSNGVPMLCWPYFGDQNYTRSCISDHWNVGMRLNPDESGIISRDEIKQKVEEIMCDGVIRENALKWKREARESIGEGGSSFTNLEHMIQQMVNS